MGRVRRPIRLKRDLEEFSEEPPKDVMIPKCPLHDLPMKFTPNDLAWACGYQGCKQIALPEAELGRGKVIMGRGDLVLLIFEERGEANYLIRCLDNNVVINITELVVGIDSEDPNLAALALLFHRIHRIDPETGE